MPRRPGNCARRAPPAYKSQAKIALALGFLLIAGIGAYTLTRAPPRVLSSPGGPAGKVLGTTHRDIAVCQPHEVLPAGTTAIRLPLIAFFGADVNVVALNGRHVIARGSRGPNWTGVSVSVPVQPLASTMTGVTLCFEAAPNSEPLIVLGGTAPTAREAAAAPSGKTLTPVAPRSQVEHLRDRLPLEYLTSGHDTWWSQSLAVARRLGLGRAYSGTWIALLVAALMLIVVGLAVRFTLKEPP
ncbi:MAG TPA: hypothetical protein VMU32_02545 [Solirubrobacteraceae bacterium]|nr:hypothetical protein [Solirubrobacteraceae bacterium]